MKTFLAVIGGAVILVAGLIVGSVLRGLVLVKLWMWFAVPGLKLPPLNAPTALGVSLIVSFLTHQTDHAKDERESSVKIVALIVEIALAPLLVLFIGWVYHLFM